MIDDDRLLDVIGVVLVVLIVVSVAVLVLAGSTADERDPGEPPDVDWTIERVGPGAVNITHAGGEPVPAGELIVSVAGVERATGREDVITEGEAITVPSRPGQEIQLFWVAGRDERVLLDAWEAP